MSPPSADFPPMTQSIHNGVTVDGEWEPSPWAGTKYEIKRDRYHSMKSKIRVRHIGAGAAGICLAYKMNKRLEPGSWDLELYEKNPMYGGTWYENTYPGCACDIPSHLYTYSWDPNPEWTHFFAYREQIQQYFVNFAQRHDIEKYMRLNTKFISAQWDEEKGIYVITLQDTKTGKEVKDWAHVLVNGTGILNTWKWPDIEGLHDFKGALMHSANWDHSVKLDGKRIGVIGNGSTAVQIVPEMQKIAGKLNVFMRSSTWISPPFGAGVLEHDLEGGKSNPGQRQFKFTEEQKKGFREDPEKLLDFRKRIEAEINSLFGIYQQKSPMSEATREKIRDEMLRRIGPGHEELKKKIIPTWAPGCRRISPGDGFLEALTQPNTTVVHDSIERITSKGILTKDGKEHELDVLICATGFKVAFKPNFKIINKDGKTVHDDWGESVNLYMGVSAPRFPNYFTMVGPGATWSSGTLLPSIETTVEYAVKMMVKMQSEGIKSLEVKQEALDDLYAHFDKYHETTVFQEECRSWFKDGKQKNRIYLWPGSTIHFLKTLKDPRMEDYEFKYWNSNRFAYLGNGGVKGNETRDVDMLSPYVRNVDHEWSVE